MADGKARTAGCFAATCPRFEGTRSLLFPPPRCLLLRHPRHILLVIPYSEDLLKTPPTQRCRWSVVVTKTSSLEPSAQ